MLLCTCFKRKQMRFVCQKNNNPTTTYNQKQTFRGHVTTMGIVFLNINVFFLLQIVTRMESCLIGTHTTSSNAGGS